MSAGKAPLRLRGTLRISERGPLLEIDDGPIWRLETQDDLQAYRDLPVRIEAWTRGTNQLELLWIGPV
ncbi:MAG: hypothetical protein CMN60_17755 [Sphingobium sp.]|uniref:DUF5818 domain-containing protein n=1 Tax=Sphingomonas melonis TaxID=152682 RepID=UPI0003607337|nr:DUF5818 domain-containing protein [Sphingomonas melonis]MBS49511.1 hypothetical protein [Sphingobium sp.]|tara:strand:+ start:183 stop:386 length:204 start_codon:yes stop_codon:yes gene_type:complete